MSQSNIGLVPLSELQYYNPNVPDQVEGIKWNLYDSIAYPSAGATQLVFFQSPEGQNGKTLADTNMTNAGMLPSPQAFLVTGLGFYFFPGEVPSAGPAAAADSAFINDVYTFWTSNAWMSFSIGSKVYLQEAPLLKMPPENGLTGFAAFSNASTAAAAQAVSVGYATAAGTPYDLNPPLLVPTTQNFKISLNWPTATPVFANAKIYCNLTGYMYRNSQ
jgi:hypothetical protein